MSSFYGLTRRLFFAGSVEAAGIIRSPACATLPVAAGPSGLHARCNSSHDSRLSGCPRHRQPPLPPLMAAYLAWLRRDPVDSWSRFGGD